MSEPRPVTLLDMPATQDDSLITVMETLKMSTLIVHYGENQLWALATHAEFQNQFSKN